MDPSTIRIKVRFFALIRDRAKVPGIEMQIEHGASVSSAIESIAERMPQLAPLLPRIACAVNQSYVDRNTLLHDGDELALIPPVSGG